MKETAKALREEGLTAHGWVMDVIDSYQVDGVVEKVIKYVMENRTDHDQRITELDELTSSLSLMKERPIEFWEVHVSWDTTGNGVEDDIVVFYHYDSMEILRATYEPLGHRPYSVVRYLDGDGFYGIGLG